METENKRREQLGKIIFNSILAIAGKRVLIIYVCIITLGTQCIKLNTFEKNLFMGGVKCTSKYFYQ